MLLTELIDMLPRPRLLPELETDAPGVTQHNVSIPHPFIEPTLTVARESGMNGGSIVLLSASAAVGKSYLARYLSGMTGNPLWDLSRASLQVGSYLFTGNLVDSYGADGYARFVADIRAGGVALVVDALDEALVRAGLANYERAIENLARLVAGAEGKRCRAILLGRPEALDFAGVKLLEASVGWTRMSIDYFSEEQGREFIRVVAADNARRRRGKQSADPVNQNPEDVRAFTDLVFSLVKAAVSSSVQGINDEQATNRAELDSFLGYAPVLSALAELADEGNAHARLQELHATDREMAVWELLSNVMEGILDRECEKIVSSSPREELCPLLATAFGSQQQITYLLQGLDPATIELQGAISHQDRDDVVHLIEQQLRDHPFIDSKSIADRDNPMLRFANVALRDYVGARVLLRGFEDEPEVLTGLWYHDRVLPSPLLVRLLLAGKPSGRLYAGALAAICDSGATRLGGRELEIVLNASATEVEFTARENGQRIGSMVFAVDGRRLEFGRSLSSCAVFAKGLIVHLGNGRSDFALGPGVFMSCDDLLVGSELIRVGAGAKTRMEVESVSGPVRRILAPDENLEVMAKSISYPWDRYAVEFVGSTYPLNEVYKAGMELRRLLKWFQRPSLAGALTYPVSAMQTIVDKGRAPRGWRDYLLQRGLLEQRGYAYALTVPCDLQSVREMSLEDPKFLELVEDYLRWVSRSNT